MKNFILTLFFVIITITMGIAQVKSETRTMVAGPQPCLTVSLPGADAKFAQSEWKDYLKPYGKVSSVKGSKETVVESIHISAIGDGSLLQVYNLPEETSDGTRMIVWIDIGEDYLADTDSNYHIAESFLLKFAHKVKVDLVAIDLEDQSKQLEKLESNLEKLQRTNEKLLETIEVAKASINDAEIGIPINETHQENARAEIDRQRDYVDIIRDDPKQLKAEKKKLAKLQNNLDKLEREHNGFHKDIENGKDKIVKAQQDIEENLAEQETVSADIENQKTIVNVVQQKHKTLKEQEE